MSSPPRAWAEVNLTALDHNLSLAATQSGQSVMAVLKAGAYGHGLIEVARHLDREELSFFGVASVFEARKIKTANISQRIYLLGATIANEREEVVANSWVPCLSTFEEIDHFAQICNEKRTPFPTIAAHLTLDTGMGRGGFLPSQIGDVLDYLSRPENRCIKLEGIGSHLPSADEDPAFTRVQIQQFDDLMSSIKGHPLFESALPTPHLFNSAGLLDYTSTTTQLVRPGLMLYGVSPLPHWQNKLQPVMTLKSRVSLIRSLPAGHGISYGRSTILEKETRVATIGIGYGDGVPRAISGQGAHVLIAGKRAPLLGRVTMDQIMADVSELPDCTVGDEVEIFGPNLLVHQVAEWAKTIPWEVLTGITPRVARIYQS